MKPRAAGDEARGFTVVEALVAIVLSGLLAGLALGAVVRARGVVEELSGRSERLAAARTARHLLGEEARAAAGVGAWVVAGDSLALRAFRGRAIVCAYGAGGREVVVVASGVRAPDPAKDSVLLLRQGGGAVALALLDREPAPPACASGPGSSERWLLSGPAPQDAVAARWFERGVYHLSARALRYRRGMAGRQPLTPEVLRTPGSGFAGRASGVDVGLLMDGGGEPDPPWRLRLREGPGGR